MRELSLFTGAGGGVLGTHLLGWRPLGYVEYNEYCQQILASRIGDGILPDAPIFGDIRAFLSDGYADAYQGMVDVITAGFPCQPFSLAGRQKGADDERNMWPQTIDVIRKVRPSFCLLENVPGIIRNYLPTVLGDLAESGYDARWRVLSAAEMGAPHKRARVWVVAYSKDNGLSKQDEDQPYPDEERNHSSPEQTGNAEHGESFSSRPHVSNSFGKRLEGVQQTGATARTTDRPGDGSHTSWWEVEPGVGRVVDGVADRVDRLTALGNGQVPAVVRGAWELLTGV